MGPGAETQALKAFFNEDLDNDSDSGDTSRRPPDSGISAPAARSPPAEVMDAGPAKPSEEMPSMAGMESEPATRDGWKHRRQANNTPSAGNKEIKASPLSHSFSDKDQTAEPASVDSDSAVVPDSLPADTQGRPVATPEDLRHSPAATGRAVTPVLAENAAEVVDADAFGSVIVPASPDTQGHSPTEPLISAHAQSEKDEGLLDTQIEAPPQFIDPGSAGKQRESAPCCSGADCAAIPETQIDILQAPLPATEGCTPLDAQADNPLQLEATPHAPPSTDGHEGGRNGRQHASAAGGTEPTLPTGGNPSSAEAHAVLAAGSGIAPSTSDAATPELQALAAGFNCPSATGTVVPESEMIGTTRCLTQPALLLPDSGAVMSRKQSASEGEPSCGGKPPTSDSVVACGLLPTEEELPAGKSEEAVTPALADTYPEGGLDVVQAASAAACTPSTTAPARSLGSACLGSMLDARGGAEAAAATDAVADAEHEHPAEDATGADSAAVSDGGPELSEGRLPPADSSPAGDCHNTADVAAAEPDTGAQDRAGDGPSTSGRASDAHGVSDNPAAPAGIDGATVAPAEDVAEGEEQPDAPATAPGDSAVEDEPEGDAKMEEGGGKPATLNSHTHDSQPDSQMLLMMTQPPDTAVNGGIFDLAKQLCGDLMGTPAAGSFRAAAGPSRLANLAQTSSSRPPSARAATAVTGSTAAATAQPPSEPFSLDADPASPNVRQEDGSAPDPLPRTGASLPEPSEPRKERDEQGAADVQTASAECASGKQTEAQKRPARRKQRRRAQLDCSPSPAPASEQAARDQQDAATHGAQPEAACSKQGPHITERDTRAGGQEAAALTLKVHDTTADAQQSLCGGEADAEGVERAPDTGPQAVKRTARLAAVAAAPRRGAQGGRPTRKRNASQTRPAADVAEARATCREPTPAAEAAVPSGAAPRGAKRRRTAEPGSKVSPAAQSLTRPSKKAVRKRSSAAEQAPAAAAASPPAEPLPAAAAQPGRKRKRKETSAAAPQTASPVPSTPRQRRSTRASAPEATLSPARERQPPVILLSSAVSLPRKLAKKAKSAGLQLREHQAGETVPEFTHFVADELVLSLHTLLALAAGRPIVTSAWLHQSIDGGAAMPVGSLLLEDFQAEKKHKFIMKSSYDTARSRKLLHGCTCCVSDSLLKSEADDGEGLKLVVQAALGSEGLLLEGDEALAEHVATHCQNEHKRVLLLVEAGADKRNLRRSVPKGVQVWTRPQFVQAVVQQTFSYQHAFLQT